MMKARALTMWLIAIMIAIVGSVNGSPTVPKVPPELKSKLIFHEEPVVPNEYIVMIDPKHDLDEHVSRVTTLLSNHKDSSILKQWDFVTGMKAYHLRTTNQKLLREIALDPEVILVESNVIFEASTPCITAENDNWGAIRIQSTSQPDYDIDRWYSISAYNGSGVNVYLIDSGVKMDHSDFSHVTFRWGSDTVDNPSPMTDLSGHGTAMAGVIVSKPHGIAPGVTIVVVRVLDQNSRGTGDSIVSGVHWSVWDYQQSQPPKHSIINFSINKPGYVHSTVAAVNRAINAGIPFVCSSGNSNMNACLVTPNTATNVISVAGTTKNEGLSTGSCFGSCVRVLAPGEDIDTTYYRGGRALSSGTSPAAAHVTAVLARKIQQSDDHDVGKLRYWLFNSGTSTATIAGAPPGTPNKMLYGPCSLA